MDCCTRIKLDETVNRLLLSEGLIYHLENDIPLNENIYRPQSVRYLELFEESRSLYESGKIELTEDDKWYFDNTDLGKWGTYKGVKVPLDYPLTLDFLLEVKALLRNKSYHVRHLTACTLRMRREVLDLLSLQLLTHPST